MSRGDGRALHGTAAMVTAGCTCEPCLTAHRQRTRQPRITVCCVREATEPEGAGHDWWCPTRH